MKRRWQYWFRVKAKILTCRIKYWNIATYPNTIEQSVPFAKPKCPPPPKSIFCWIYFFSVTFWHVHIMHNHFDFKCLNFHFSSQQCIQLMCLHFKLNYQVSSIKYCNTIIKPLKYPLYLDKNGSVLGYESARLCENVVFKVPSWFFVSGQCPCIPKFYHHPYAAASRG